MLGYAGRRKSGVGVTYLVKCRCACGTEKGVNAGHVKSGGSKSCGCHHSEVLAKRNRTHGKSKSSEYSNWKAMNKRYYNNNDEAFCNYGDRGIRVVKRWRGPEGFTNFLTDMGKKPTEKATIERRDNDGDYSPSNCYWAPRQKQNRNKRNNLRRTYHGETKCLAEWADIFGIPYSRLHYRIAVLGWTLKKAVETPSRYSK